MITCERDQQLVEVSAKALAFQNLGRFYMRTLTSDCALSKFFSMGGQVKARIKGSAYTMVFDKLVLV